MIRTTLVAILFVAMLAIAPIAFASESAADANPNVIVITTNDPTESLATTSPEIPVVGDESADRAELKSLKQKEQDPSLGFFSRLIIGFKIKQLEAQLNIKKALK